MLKTLLEWMVERRIIMDWLVQLEMPRHENTAETEKRIRHPLTIGSV